MGSKLEPSWIGPYEVTETLTKGRVKLRNCASSRKLKNVYHASNLKVYSAQEDLPAGEDGFPAGKSASKCKQEEENLHQNKRQKVICMFSPLPLDARQNMAEAFGLPIA